MILVQHEIYRNYYLPTQRDSRFFIFSIESSDQRFDFKNAYHSYNFNFLLAFYEAENTINEDQLRMLQTELSREVQSGRKIYWINDLTKVDLNNCPNFNIINQNVVNSFNGTVWSGNRSKSYINLK